MAEKKSGQIDSVMKEERLFPPPEDFSAKARIGSAEEYERLWKEAADDPEAFWGKLAEELHWFQPFEKVLEWDEPFAKWFAGGQTNVSYNCLDAHLETHRRDKPAIIWEGEPGDQRTLTYHDLHQEVCRFANALKGLGIEKGDVVTPRPLTRKVLPFDVPAGTRNVTFPSRVGAVISAPRAASV